MYIINIYNINSNKKSNYIINLIKLIIYFFICIFIPFYISIKLNIPNKLFFMILIGLSLFFIWVAFIGKSKR